MPRLGTRGQVNKQIVEYSYAAGPLRITQIMSLAGATYLNIKEAERDGFITISDAVPALVTITKHGERVL